MPHFFNHVKYQHMNPTNGIQIAIAIAINLEYELVLDPREIVLEICYPKYGVHYTSAIALAISNRLGIEALQIAEKTIENFLQSEMLRSPPQLVQRRPGPASTASTFPPLPAPLRFCLPDPFRAMR